jgi:hypothetical protein
MKFRSLACLGTLLAQALAIAQTQAVEIYVNSHDDSDRLLGPSRPMVSDVFRKIGVLLTWRKGDVPARRNALGIRTEEHAPASASAEALAATELRASTSPGITIYEDRLQAFWIAGSLPAPVAAGYVLAHELTHAIQGVARHSDSGIMKAHWSESDFQQMMFRKLEFAPVDVDLIHRGLAAMTTTPSATAGDQGARISVYEGPRGHGPN